MPFFYVFIHWSVKLKSQIPACLLDDSCSLSLVSVLSSRQDHHKPNYLLEQDEHGSWCRLRVVAPALCAGRASKPWLLGHGDIDGLLPALPIWEPRKPNSDPMMARFTSTNSCLCFWSLPTPFPWEEGSQMGLDAASIRRLQNRVVTLVLSYILASDHQHVCGRVIHSGKLKEQFK